jgi:hypothetical protein
MDPSSPLFWLLAGLVALVAAGPLARLALAALLGPAIGRAALAQQPEEITLAPAAPDDWRDRDTIERTGLSLEAEGFALAGDFAIPEMPGARVRLLAHEGRGWFAAIHEHVQTGVWFDLVHRHSDGTTVTWTTSPPSGLEDRPGHPIHRVIGAHPAELFLRACREAAATHIDCEPAWRVEAAEVFRRAHAESVAWRRQRGPSRHEALRAAGRDRAA